MLKIFNKIAGTIEMSFDIPASDKKQANNTIQEFKKVLQTLNAADRHLDMIYTPFKESQDIDPNGIYEFRGAVYRYRQEIQKNFDLIKKTSFFCINQLNYFTTDTHIFDLLNSFKDSIETLEQLYDILFKVLDNLKDKSFKDNLVKAVEEIKGSFFEIEKLVNDRIIDYIDKNILAKDWVTDVGENLHQTISERVPYITQLYLERQRALGNQGHNAS